MLETQVTQEMWQSVMGNNPSHFKGAKLPVESVTWNDCQEYITKLNALLAGTPGAPAGYKFSLPTEAQWEYACRAGTTTVYSFGNTLTQQQASFDGQQPKEVGSYPANAWGLRDMHGNVWEWCADWYGDYSSGSVTDPMGASSGSIRVVRGGSWFNTAEFFRSANRGSSLPTRGGGSVGLRLSLVRADVTAELPPLSPEIRAQHPQPHQILSQVQEAISKGNEVEADRIAQECIKLAETQGEDSDLIHILHLKLGHMFLDAEMYGSAHRHLSEVANQGGRHVFPLALCKAKSGDVDGGFSLLLDEIDRDPSVRDEMLPGILALLNHVHPLKPSETMFEKIDRLMNRVETGERISLDAITALAHWWIIRGSPERSIPLYEEVLTRNNLDGIVPAWVSQNTLAMLYSQVLGQHQKALAVVDQALATRTDNITLLNTKGLILINAGRPAAAIPLLQRAVELSDQHPVFCMHLAYAFHLDDRVTQARRYFDTARDQLIPLVPDMTKENRAMYDALLLAHPY
jgi:tetratricopeptide (TPR) repeat protein